MAVAPKKIKFNFNLTTARIPYKDLTGTSWQILATDRLKAADSGKMAPK